MFRINMRGHSQIKLRILDAWSTVSADSNNQNASAAVLIQSTTDQYLCVVALLYCSITKTATVTECPCSYCCNQARKDITRQQRIYYRKILILGSGLEHCPVLGK
jgi:hypothetical protein